MSETSWSTKDAAIAAVINVELERHGEDLSMFHIDAIADAVIAQREDGRYVQVAFGSQLIEAISENVRYLVSIMQGMASARTSNAIVREYVRAYNNGEGTAWLRLTGWKVTLVEANDDESIMELLTPSAIEVAQADVARATYHRNITIREALESGMSIQQVVAETGMPYGAVSAIKRTKRLSFAH